MANESRDAHPYSANDRALGGAVAGMVAGVVMGVVAMIRSAAVGLGFWLPMKNIAALFYGVDALIEGAGAAVVGMLIHLAVAGGAGLLFGVALGHRLNALTAFLAGLVWGVVIWAVNTWLILPWANEVMLNRVMVAPIWWFVYHLVFGGTLAVVPSVVEAFAGGQTESRRADTGRLRTQPS